VGDNLRTTDNLGYIVKKEPESEWEIILEQMMCYLSGFVTFVHSILLYCSRAFCFIVFDLHDLFYRVAFMRFGS
jgi:hypothetical protein